MQEKRQFVRLDVNVKVNWEKIVGEAPEPSEKENVSRNISEGGICLIVYEQLGVGEKIKLDIELPSQKKIAATGRIAWINEFAIGQVQEKRYDAGIEFLEISPQDREEIKKFVFTLLDQKGA
ncbi:MAG: PilZ domain-containing protein [Candidatus Omnitrophota bacterium]